jgi:hypothetical protein
MMRLDQHSCEKTMHNSEIRLECLKLASRPGLSPHEIIAAARDFLAWVNGMPDPITAARPDDSLKEGRPAPSVSRSDKPLEKRRSAATT